MTTLPYRPLHCAFCGVAVECIETWYCRYSVETRGRKVIKEKAHMPLCVSCAEEMTADEMGAVYEAAVLQGLDNVSGEGE